MAKYRQIHVSFWQDPFIMELTPEEKYFYLFLMTNSKTSACGIYELSKKIMEFETGYNRETVEKLLARFIEYGKIEYSNETREIYLVNWLKHNLMNNPKVAACIKQELLTIKTKEFADKARSCLSGEGHADMHLYRLKNKSEISSKLALQIFSEDGNECTRCKSPENLTIDHIFPRSMGGTNHRSNLRTFCRPCNSKRPITGSALVEDLAKDGFTLDDMARICPDRVSKTPDRVSETQGGEHNRTELEESTDANASGSGNRVSATPQCPHQKIIDLYHTHLAMGTQVRIWTGTRAKHLQARWREAKDRQTPEWWGKFFAYIAQSKFLTGQVTKPDRDPFVLSLGWIVKPENFAKILEGNYHRSAS